MAEIKEKQLGAMQEDGADFGNFYPVGHVMLALPDEETARTVLKELVEAGFTEAGCHYMSDRTVSQGAARGMESAGLLSMIGSSLKMVEMHKSLADQGCHFLLVSAPERGDEEHLMRVVRRHPYELAQKYRRLTIEKLK